jgi:hypothetical protein
MRRQQREMSKNKSRSSRRNRGVHEGDRGTKGKITPTTPPEVLAEREQQEALQTNMIAREAKEVARTL